MVAPSIPQRREIAEEDECPICGNELPPKGSHGETADQETHVQDCISAHTYGSTPPPIHRTNSTQRESQQPAEGVASASTSIPTASSSSLPLSVSMGPSSSHASGASRMGQPRRMTGGRMFVYKATEKDCLGEDGQPSECVICFEEFEEGDDMARLVCLCKFHRVSSSFSRCGCSSSNACHSIVFGNGGTPKARVAVLRINFMIDCEERSYSELFSLDRRPYLTGACVLNS